MTAQDPAFAAKLRGAVRGVVREAEPLSRHSTYRIGGPATVLLPAHPEDVGRALTLASEAGVPVFALGLGSNLLFPDEGLDALVIRLGKGLDRVVQDGSRWTFGAGLPAPLAARRTAEAGWSGLHVMVGVPGTVGGGVYMNAGCHGGEWKDVVRTVTVVDRTGQDHVLRRDQIRFAYRDSGLGDVIVLEVATDLTAEDPVRLAATVQTLFEWRQRGTPFNQPCCGSVFRNPDPATTGSGGVPDGLRTAGQLIEAAGLKGTRHGGAEVSPMHANYFVNVDRATAHDVVALMRRVRDAVRDRFGVELHPEVRRIAADGTVGTTLP